MSEAGAINRSDAQRILPPPSGARASKNGVSRRMAAAIFTTGAAFALIDPARSATGEGPVLKVTDRHIEIVSPAMLEDQARALLPAAYFEYIHGAAGDGWTTAQNVERLRALTLWPRRMAGFVDADPSSSFMGVPVKAPIYVCPMGAQDFANAQAELATARGAALAGVPYILSSASNRPLEEVARAMAPGSTRLFAIYLNTDAGVNRSLAERARAAGFSALVLTVDSLGPGVSERFIAMGAPKTPIGGFGNFDPARGGVGRFLDLRKDFRPEDIGFLRAASGLPVIVKGLLRPDDAERAIAGGAPGIVVSNHGGRTLDGAPAAIDALGPVVAAVRGRVPVLFDSGVRRGTDVIRALALGATAVGIGRPVLDAAAVGGGQGVADLLEWFQKDLAVQMLQVGVRRVSDLGSLRIG